MRRFLLLPAGCALLLFGFAARAPAAAEPVAGTMAASLTSGPEAGARASLALRFDTAAGGGFSAATAADQAILSLDGTPLLTVPAFVMDASAPPGVVTYRADPASGGFFLGLTYNFQMRYPRGWQTRSTLSLSGWSPIPLLTHPLLAGPLLPGATTTGAATTGAATIDPAFFADFVGTGSVFSYSGGIGPAVLSGSGQPGFQQTTLSFGFAVGVPEPSAAAVLAGGALLTLGCAAATRRLPSRRALPYQGAAPRRQGGPAP